MYDLVISAGYSLTGIDIKRYYELNFIKLGNLFPIYKNFIVGRKQQWLQICQ